MDDYLLSSNIWFLGKWEGPMVKLNLLEEKGRQGIIQNVRILVVGSTFQQCQGSKSWILTWGLGIKKEYLL